MKEKLEQLNNDNYNSLKEFYYRIGDALSTFKNENEKILKSVSKKELDIFKKIDEEFKKSELGKYL